MTASTTSEDKLRKLLKRLRALHLLRIPPDCELSPSQFAMLAWISRSPGCGVLEIAAALKLTAPTVSVSIQRLAKEGWLERHQDLNDLRAKPIYLTERSAILMETLRAHQARTLKHFLSGLNQNEQKQFLTLFERAISNMEINKSEIL